MTFTRKWTDEEDNILREEYATADLYDLSRRLGRSWQAVNNRAHKVLGSSRHRPRFDWDGERDSYLLAHLTTKSNREIGDVLGCHAYVVNARIQKLRQSGVINTVLRPPSQGERGHRPILTVEPPWIELKPVNTGGGRSRRPPAGKVHASGELTINHAAAAMLVSPSGRVLIHYHPEAERIRLIPTVIDGANGFALSGGGNAQYRLSAKQMVRDDPHMIGDYVAIRFEGGIELRKQTDAE